MAKKSSTLSTASKFRKRAKVSRPGVHSKKRTSKLKSSKNYTKKYRGQG